MAETVTQTNYVVMVNEGARSFTLTQRFSNCGPRTTSGPLRLIISPKKTEKD
jgi:hypothetical protein